MKAYTNTNKRTVCPELTDVCTLLLQITQGEKKVLTLPSKSRFEFICLSPDILAIGDTVYDKDLGTSSVEVMGLKKGDAMLLAVNSHDNTSVLIKVKVRRKAFLNEKIDRAAEAVFSSTPDNSPANETAANLGDGRENTKWLIFGSHAKVDIDIGAPSEVFRLTLTSANDDPGRDPSAICFWGSPDGEIWDKLFESDDINFENRHQTKEYDLFKTGKYRYYKLEILKNHGLPMVQLAKIGLIEIGKEAKEQPFPPVKTPSPSPVSGISLQHDRLILKEGGSVVISAKTEGICSPVFFTSSDKSLGIAGLSYNEKDGTTKAKLFGNGSGRGQLIAYTSRGSVFKVIDFSVIGEGACSNVTRLFEARGRIGTADVDVTKLFDDDRMTVEAFAFPRLDIILSTKNTVLVNRYAIVGGDELSNAPVKWKFYGSTNSDDWILLDERENESFEGKHLKRIFDFENNDYYPHYKLTLTGCANTLSLSEIQLFEMGAYPSWALGPFEKIDEANPILTPNDIDCFSDPVSGGDVYWSEEALYNPAAVVKDGVICVLYRSQDHPLVSRVGLALSNDGIHFNSLPHPVLYPENDEFYPFEVGGGDEDPRVIKGSDGIYYMYYSSYNREKGICRLFVATSKDLTHWKKQGNAIGDAYNGKYKDLWAKSGSVICDMVGEEFIARKFDDGKYYMYFGEGTLYMAWSYDLIHWTPLENNEGNLLSVLSPRRGYYDSRLVEPGPPAIYTEYGILLIYNGANAHPGGSGDSMIIYNAYSPGQVVFDAKDPTKVIKITENCFMYPEKDYELQGLVNNVCFVEGLVYYQDSWFLYYGTADSRLAVAVYKGSKRNDEMLLGAIAKAEARTSLSDGAKHALRVAKEASLSAIYSQTQADEIAKKLLDMI